MLRAKWTASIGLSLTLLFITFMSVLNRSLDRPDTLTVNNRYARLAPRIAIAVTVACINLKHDLAPEALMAIAMVLLWLDALWEFYAGLEKDAKILEPKRMSEPSST